MHIRLSGARTAAATLAAIGLLVPAAPAHADQIATPAAAAAASSYFNWVDHASAGMTLDNIHLLNPGGSPSSGRLLLAGAWEQPFTVPATGEGYLAVPAGLIGGPVRVVVDRGPPVIASQRVVYQGTISEVPAVAATAALSRGYFTWYDLSSAGMTTDNIHFLNPGLAASSGRLSLPGATPLDFTVGPGEERYLSFPRGSIGGPVSFEISSGPPVVASQRSAYLQSFTETAALDPALASAQLFFNWYDHASPGINVDDLHLLNPGASSSSGTISAPGLPDLTFDLAAGAERHYSWPLGSKGGPVAIRVALGPPVLATQRLAMPPVFTEWTAQAPSSASPDSWFNWYDHWSQYSVDDLHVMNPGPSPASVQISLPGHATANLSVAAGQDSRFSFPAGTIGGPIRVQVLAGPAVITSQRAWLLPAPATPVILPVPSYRQEYRLSCEEAALRMALAYQGIAVTEDQILAAEGIDLTPRSWDSAGGFHWGDPYASFVGDPNGSEAALTGYGAYATVIDRVARGFGGRVLASGEGIAAGDVYANIGSGHPVIAWVSFDWRSHNTSRYLAFDGREVQFGAPYEHAVTLVGVTPDAVLVNNPWSGQEWRSKASFEAAYDTFNRMAVVLQ